MRRLTKRRQQVIDRLMARARRAARTVNRALDEMDCGRFLAGVIRPGVAQAELDYESCMRRLRRIDPRCPGYTGRKPHA